MGSQGEGPALFHSAGSTYMLMSGLTGWNPNPANLVATTAPRLCGAWWKQQPNPAATEGGNITFNSQSTFVLPLQLGGGQTLFIYMGDRWNFKGPGSVRPLLKEHAGCHGKACPGMRTLCSVTAVKSVRMSFCS